MFQAFPRPRLLGYTAELPLSVFAFSFLVAATVGRRQIDRPSERSTVNAAALLTGTLKRNEVNGSDLG